MTAAIGILAEAPTYCASTVDLSEREAPYTSGGLAGRQNEDVKVTQTCFVAASL